MSELLYIDDLKRKLCELGDVEQELVKCKIQKETIRDQIKQWLDINKIKDHETLDNNGTYWRINIQSQIRKKVDVDAIAVENPELVNRHINYNEIEVFTCQPVKSMKQQKKKETPVPPTGIVN